MPQGAFRQIGLLDRVVRVDCADAADLAWLEVNVTPPFVVAPGGLPCCHVHYVNDREHHAELAALGPDASGRTLPCFTLDSTVVHHPLLAEHDGERLLIDHELGAIYGIRADARHVRIVHGRPGRWGRVALLRVVRELLVGGPGNRLLLHAGGMAQGDQAFAIGGPKFAGKTTLLAHLLGAPSTAFVANDRLVLYARGGAVIAQGVPTVVRVRAGTANRFADRLAPRRLAQACVGPAEGGATRGRPGVDGDGNITLSPAQFAEAFGAPRACGGYLAAIIVPRITPDQRGARAHRLNLRDAARALRACRTGSAARGAATVFAELAPAIPDGLPALDEASLVRAVPVVRLDLGDDAYRATPAADMLAMILDAAARRPAGVRRSGAFVVVPLGHDDAGAAATLASTGSEVAIAAPADVLARLADVLPPNITTFDSGRPHIGQAIRAVSAGRAVAVLPPGGIAAAHHAHRLDAIGLEAMILAPDATLAERTFQEARPLPLGWALSPLAADRLLPDLDTLSASALYRAARRHVPALHWRSAPAAGDAAGATDARPTLDRRSRVLAVVPHFRCEAYLAEALESLVGQTRPPQAIAVIDDGSGRPPVAICAAFPSVTLYASAANVGPYGLVHALLARTSFDALLFQDADDWSMADRLALLLAEAERTGAEMVGTQEIRQDETDGTFRLALYPSDVNLACAEAPHHTLLHPTSLVATGLIARLGGLASGLRFSGDTELLYRAVFAARVTNIPEFAYVRRDRAASLTRSAATGLQSPVRKALLARLSERGRAMAAARARGEAIDLAPLETRDPVPLVHLSGPELRDPRPETLAPQGSSPVGAVP